jgi:hypothetical protein
MTRTVQFFDQPCCGPSAAASLSTFLAERVDGDVEVSYHNLNEPVAESVRVPASLVHHLTSGGTLPVMIVDGAISAAGTLPNLMDALDLATGRTRPARHSVLPMAAPGTESARSGRCC